MRDFQSIFKRELNALFQSPQVYFYVFALILINVLFAFNIGQLIELNDASMVSYFQFHPWLYLVFVSALGMRSFCDDNRGGQSELLLSLPIGSSHLILGKYFALLIVCFVAILFCLPLAIAVSLMGSLDWGIVFSSMLASAILASCLLSLSVFVSVYNKNQTLSFIVSTGLGLLLIGSSMPFLVSGIEAIGGFGQLIARFLAIFSIFDGFDKAINGSLQISWIFLNLAFISLFLILAVAGFEGKRRGRL